MRHVHLLIKPASGLCKPELPLLLLPRHCGEAGAGLLRPDDRGHPWLRCWKRPWPPPATAAPIAFQGGEPTLAGLDFFRKAVELQRRLNVNRVQVYNSIQTNGLLLDSPVGGVLPGEPFSGGALFGRDEGHPRPLPPGRPGPGDVQPGGARPSAAGKPRGCVQYFNGGQQGHRPACGKDIPLLPAQPLGGTCNLFLAWTPWARSREARPTP